MNFFNVLLGLFVLITIISIYFIYNKVSKQQEIVAATVNLSQNFAYDIHNIKNAISSLKNTNVDDNLIKKINVDLSGGNSNKYNEPNEDEYFEEENEEEENEEDEEEQDEDYEEEQDEDENKINELFVENNDKSNLKILVSDDEITTDDISEDESSDDESFNNSELDDNELIECEHEDENKLIHEQKSRIEQMFPYSVINSNDCNFTGVRIYQVVHNPQNQANTESKIEELSSYEPSLNDSISSCSKKELNEECEELNLDLLEETNNIVSEKINYDKYSLNELKTIAKNKGISNLSKLKKNEIIKLIEKQQSK